MMEWAKHKSLWEFCEIKSSTLPFKRIAEYQNSNNGTQKILALKVSDMNLPGNEFEITHSIIEFRACINKKTKNKFVPSGSIIFPKRGAAIATNKKRLLKLPAILDPNLIAVIPSNETVLEYINFFFQSFDLKNITDTNTIPQLNKKDLEPISIPLPDLPEQRKIAYVLSTVQKAIEKQDQLIKITTEFKKALMQKLFTEGLFGEKQKETEIGLVPESWEIQPFENTGKVVYGIQAAVANNLKPIGKKILTNKNITLDGKINLEKLNYFELTTKRHFQTLLQKDDLLFNWRSGSKAHVGKTALFDLTDGEYTHSSFILRIRVNEKHHSIFLYYYLNFLRETGYYQKVQTYSINAKFNKSAINSMPIALPDKNEQIEIAKIISTADQKLDNLIAMKKAKQDLFNTLLHELMTGQRRVHELDFEGKVKKYELTKFPMSMATEE